MISVAPVDAADKVNDPEKIAEDVYACFQLGASMVHLHCRDKNGRLTSD
ncbi:MAG TPA: 3-keto-5-aminohexanoate cleavage protein, partial [Lachnospiraceae bacterium]|nr:3-keto-5-aminohexanoate cleavage protein [Lachnospiraceae bacterium]